MWEHVHTRWPGDCCLQDLVLESQVLKLSSEKLVVGMQERALILQQSDAVLHVLHELDLALPEVSLANLMLARGTDVFGMPWILYLTLSCS